VNVGRFARPETLIPALEEIARHEGMGGRMEEFRREPRHRDSPTWLDHEDINAVMLAAALVPHVFLRREPRSAER